jgi:hypothetical protein
VGLIQPAEQLGYWLTFDDTRRFVREFEQDRDDVLAVSAPVVGAAAPCFGDPAVVQSDGNLIGRKLAALHFRRQSIVAPNEFGNGPVVEVVPPAREGFGRGKCANRPFRDMSLDHPGPNRNCHDLDASR